ALIARTPQPRFLHRLAAPEQALGASLAVPLLRGGAQLCEIRGVLVVLVEPALQRRPRLDQRFVNELDGAGAFAARLYDEQASAHEVRDDAIDIWTHVAELGDVDDRARALRRDEAL